MADNKWWEAAPLANTQPQATPSTTDDNSWYQSAPLANQPAQADSAELPPSVTDNGIPIVGDNTPEGLAKYKPLPKTPEDLQAQEKEFSDNEQAARQKEIDKRNYKGGQVAPDFIPNTAMYDNDQDPQATYEALKSQAKEFSITGEPIINGRIVPKPGAYDWTPNYQSLQVPTNPLLGPYPKVQQNVMDAGREGVRNILETGAAILDQALGDKNSTMAKTVDKWVAAPPEAEGMDSLVRDATKLTAASVLGAKAGMKGAKTLSNNPTFGKAIAGLASYFSTIGSMNKDDPTLVTGKNALAPLVKGAETSDGTYSGEIVQNKINQGIDAIMAGIPGVTVGHATAYMGNLLNNLVFKHIVEGVSPNAVRLKVGREFLSQLGTYGELDAKTMDKAIQYVKDNREELLQLGDKSIPDAVIARTPMSAIHEGASKVGEHNLANRAMELEASGIKLGVPELATAKEQPIRTLENTTGAAADSRGGLSTVDKVGQMMANDAIDTLGTAHTNLRNTKTTSERLIKRAQSQADQDIANAQLQAHNTLADVTQANQNVLNQTKSDVNDVNLAAQNDVDKVSQTLDYIYKNDPTFGATIEQLSKDSGIDVASKFKASATQEIMPKLVQAAKEMKDTKNGLYNAIPENAAIDEHSLAASIKPLLDEGWLSKGVASSILQRMGANETLDFKYLFNEVLPKINGEISREIQLGPQMNVDKLNALQGVKKNIYEDQMQYLIDNGDEETSKAAQAAVNYYKTTYVKYTRDSQTPIGQLFNAIDDSFDSHLAERAQVGDVLPSNNITDLGQNYRVTDTANQVVNSLSDKKPGSSQQVIDFMSEPTYRGGKDDLTKVMRGEVAGAIADHFQQGGTIDNLNPSIIYNTLKDKGVVLKKNLADWTTTAETMINTLKKANLDKKSALEKLQQTQEIGKAAIDEVTSKNKILENFIKQEGETNVKNITEQAKQNVKDVTQQAEKDVLQAKRAAKKTETKVKKSALDKFIEVGPEGPLPKQNSYDVFKNLLTRNNNENRIQQIAAKVKAAKDPEAQKGLESAFFNMLRDKVVSPTNDKRLAGAQVNKILSDKNSIKKYGEMIFGNYDDPKERQASLDTFNTMNKLIDLVYNEQKKSSNSSISLMEKLNTHKEAVAAFGYLSRLAFGALSREGTMVSTTGSRVIKMVDPDSVAREVVSKAMTDNDYFVKLAEDVKQQFLKGTMSKEDRDALIRAGVLLGKQETTNTGKSWLNPKEENLKKPFSTPENLK